jgi:hypothetical protein
MKLGSWASRAATDRGSGGRESASKEVEKTASVAVAVQGDQKSRERVGRKMEGGRGAGGASSFTWRWPVHDCTSSALARVATRPSSARNNLFGGQQAEVKAAARLQA